MKKIKIYFKRKIKLLYGSIVKKFLSSKFVIILNSGATFITRDFIPLMDYIPKWSDTVEKFRSKFMCQVCVTILERCAVTISWWRSLSYRKQSVDLLYRSMDWFLFDRDLRHERFKRSELVVTKYCHVHSLFFCDGLTQKVPTWSIFFRKTSTLFFNFYLVAPRPTLGYYRGGSLTHPMLITAFLQFRLKGHREPCNEVRSLGTAKRLVGTWTWNIPIVIVTR